MIFSCTCTGVDMGSYDSAVELVPPSFMPREDGRGICVDACLALEITQLWSRGIRTTGCCCGHGRLEPTIGVSDESAEEMLAAGYVRHPNPHDPDAHVFQAKSGWPARPAAPTQSAAQTGEVLKARVDTLVNILAPDQGESLSEERRRLFAIASAIQSDLHALSQPEAGR